MPVEPARHNYILCSSSERVMIFLSSIVAETAPLPEGATLDAQYIYDLADQIVARAAAEHSLRLSYDTQDGLVVFTEVTLH